jgi:magnesium transporter
MSHRLNEVMKVLTIIATIFIPLTFVAGIYGMNFDRSSPWNLPELGWRYGYPACLLAMAALGGALYLWFRRKGWIGSDSDRRGAK